ncbi:MAG: LptF/LptG family permease [Alphaproteobacteria bacterium]|nr:LptF/LptG family permease [Alphaproteobacteria bacterium]
MRKVKILDRYIASQILVGSLIVGTILLGIAWFSQIIRLLSFLVNNSAGFGTFLRLTSLLIPELFVIIMPIALFAVILFTYAKMISDRELVVMQATGRSPDQIARPAIFISWVMALMCWTCSLWLSPISAAYYRDMRNFSAQDLSSFIVKEGEFNQLSRGITIYVKNTLNNVMTDIFVDDTRNPNTRRTIIAQRGVLKTGERSALLILEHGSIQDKGGGKYTFGTFETYTADLAIATTDNQRTRRPDERPTLELVMARASEYESNPRFYKALKAELHRRIIAPLLNPLFALVALFGVFKMPMSGRSSNRFTLVAIGIMIGLQMAVVSAYDLIQTHSFIWPMIYIAIISLMITFRRLIK